MMNRFFKEKRKKEKEEADRDKDHVTDRYHLLNRAGPCNPTPFWGMHSIRPIVSAHIQFPLSDKCGPGRGDNNDAFKKHAGDVHCQRLGL